MMHPWMVFEEDEVISEEEDEEAAGGGLLHEDDEEWSQSEVQPYAHQAQVPEEFMAQGGIASGKNNLLNPFSAPLSPNLGN
jgi:hypothetical protein